MFINFLKRHLGPSLQSTKNLTRQASPFAGQHASTCLDPLTNSGQTQTDRRQIRQLSFGSQSDNIMLQPQPQNFLKMEPYSTRSPWPQLEAAVTQNQNNLYYTNSDR